MNMIVPKTWSTVITDASFCDKSKVAGWAAWIRVDGINDPIKRYGSFRTMPQTSTDAEMLSAINGIWIAKQFGANGVLLQTDCLSVVHLIDGTTIKRKTKDRWIRYLASAGILDIDLRAKHVRGHTKVDDARSYVNRWCDRNAKMAMREARK